MDTFEYCYSASRTNVNLATVRSCSLRKREREKKKTRRYEYSECGVWSESPLFAKKNSYFSLEISKPHSLAYLKLKFGSVSILC